MNLTWLARQSVAFGAGLYGTLQIGRDDDVRRRAFHVENLHFYGAPHAAFLFVPGYLVERNLADIGIYAQTLMLAMKGYGVDSCAQGILGFYGDAVRDALDVGADFKLLFGISFGYADPDAPVNAFGAVKEPVPDTVRFLG